MEKLLDREENEQLPQLKQMLSFTHFNKLKQFLGGLNKLEEENNEIKTIDSEIGEQFELSFNHQFNRRQEFLQKKEAKKTQEHKLMMLMGQMFSGTQNVTQELSNLNSI